MVRIASLAFSILLITVVVHLCVVAGVAGVAGVVAIVVVSLNCHDGN